MKTIARFAALTALLVAPVAFAQPAAKKPAEPPAAPAMPVPKPDAALDQYKSMIGTWKCTGKMTMMGKEIPTKSTAKFSWDMDNFWVVAKFDSPKTKDMPGYKGTAYYGYDAANKVYTNTMFDNMGGWGQATSKGIQGDTEEWTGKGMMMGQMMEMKSTIKTISPKEVHITGTMGSGPQAIKDETVCKK